MRKRDLETRASATRAKRSRGSRSHPDWRPFVSSAWRLELVDDALQIAPLHGATVYDSCYVALGAQLSIPLITADEALVRRFSGTDHEVLWLGDPALGLASG